MRVTALLAPVLGAGLTVLSGLSACSGSQPRGGDAVPEAGADRAVRLDEHRTLGAPLTVGNLRVWPVHTDAPLDVGEFLTLAEAQEAGVAKVREVGGATPAQVAAVQTELAADAEGELEPEQLRQRVSDMLQNLSANSGASVGTLEVVNDGDMPILILAGTVVKGGNQDRQLGQDVVVAAGATVPVEAFCVEQGRWSNSREGVATDGEFVALKTFTNADVRKNAQYAKDQSAVWHEVAVARAAAFDGPAANAAIVRTRSSEPQTDFDVDIAAASQIGDPGVGDPGGSTFIDVLEKSSPELVAKREETAAAVVAYFGELAAGPSAPVGFAYAIGDEPVTVRAFAHSRLFEQNLESFANAMAVEASIADGDSSNCTGEDVVAMVKDIAGAEEKRSRTGAANSLGLRQNDTGWNGNCYFDSDGDGTPDTLTQDWTRR